MFFKGAVFSRVHATKSLSVRWSHGAKTPKGDLTCLTAPAHPYATDTVVYMALLIEIDHPFGHFSCHVIEKVLISVISVIFTSQTKVRKVYRYQIVRIALTSTVSQ